MNSIAFSGKVPTQLVTKEIAERYVGKAPMGEALEASKKAVVNAEEKLAKTLSQEYANAHCSVGKATDALSADKLAEAYRAAHGIVQK